MRKKSKTIITCAITGSIHTPSMSPHLPVTPDQIATQAVEAAEAGAAILHLHARDPQNGRPSGEPDTYNQFLPRIKQGTDAVLNLTTGGGMIMLRYQILDSDKVLSVHDAQTAPYVVGPDGKKYDAPGMQGHSHIGKKKVAGTTDYILLANSGGRLKPGMVVTVVAGQLRMPNVTVV